MDEQTKKEVLEAFRVSCFLHDEKTGRCAYLNNVRNCDGLCMPMRRFKNNLEKLLNQKRP